MSYENIIKSVLFKFFKDKKIKILKIEQIGSSILSDKERSAHDISKYGRERSDFERDIDYRVTILGINKDDVERWAFSEESEELEMAYGLDVQLVSLFNKITKGININDKEIPFTDLILSGKKTIETRNSRSLDSVVGERVGVIRTGVGRATLVGYVTIGVPKFYKNSYEFDKDYKKHRVGSDSSFYIGSGGKYGYPLIDVERVVPLEVNSKGIVIRRI